MMNMQSTQRIEAIHSAVAGFLDASTLLTDLATKLDAYNTDVARRAETRTFKHQQKLEKTAEQCISSHQLISVASPATHILNPFSTNIWW